MGNSFQGLELAKPDGPGFQKRPTSFALNEWKLSLLVQFLDLCIIFVVALFCLNRFRLHLTRQPVAVVLGALAFAFFVKNTFIDRNLYDLAGMLNVAQAMRHLLSRWALTIGLMAAVLFVLYPVDRWFGPWLLLIYLGGLAAFFALRMLSASQLERGVDRGLISQNLAILGANNLAEQMVAYFKNNRQGVKFCGIFDDRNRDNITSIGGVPKLGGVDELIEMARVQRVDFVIITLPITAVERLNIIGKRFKQLPVNVRIMASPIGFSEKSNRRPNRFDLPGLQLVELQSRPISEPASIIKAAIDRILAAIGLLLLSPVLLGCAIGIKTASRGPVFFRQVRIGYKGRPFKIFKFRTMHVATEENKTLTTRGDPRVFPFGRILRKLSLDEMPQLINVLKGQMSLVGPRPHMPEARAAGALYFDAVQEYADRHRVMPGITGWAQVNGRRGPTDTRSQLEQRVEFDLYYIEHWSFGLDLIILLRTVFIGFFGKNAF